MAAEEREYRRLPGRGVRRQGIATAARTRLWLARDHLLAVDYQWYSEDYKRFYFRDIQAVILRKTRTGRTINEVLTPLTCIVLALALSLTIAGGPDELAFGMFWWIIGAVLLAFLVANILLGPTCRCHLKTAVQTEELPSLRRLRRARKVLARVRPLIVAAQGELTLGEIAARMGQATGPGAAFAAGGDVNAPLEPPPA
jgi:hypothetical protein